MEKTRIRMQVVLHVLINVLALLFILITPVVVVKAGTFDQQLTAQDQANFQQMFQPLLRLFMLFKFGASILGGVYLGWGAITLITSGDDFKKREGAKSKLMVTLIGMVIVWGIPYFLNFMFNV